MTAPMEDLLTALLVERYSGTWWLRRAKESMAEPEDDLEPVRRRRALARGVRDDKERRLPDGQTHPGRVRPA